MRGARQCDGAGAGARFIVSLCLLFLLQSGRGVRGAGHRPPCVMRTVMDTSIAEPGTCVALLQGPCSIYVGRLITDYVHVCGWCM